MMGHRLLSSLLCVLLCVVPAHASGFFDHFDSTLNARWTAVTGGTGTATLTDGYLRLNRPVSTDKAYVYLNTKLEKAVDWSIAIAVNPVSTVLPIPVNIIEDADPGGLTGVADYSAVHVVRVFETFNVAGIMSRFSYVDGSGNRQRWNHTTAAFANADGGAGSNPAAQADDYYIAIMQNDGTNQRFRLGLLHESPGGSTYTFNQGPRLVMLTDWVNWTSVRGTPQSNLYLVLGLPINDTTTSESRIEWIKYRQGTYRPAWVNGRSTDSGDYDIRKWVTMEDIALPVDRSSTAVNPAYMIKDPWVVDSAGVRHMFIRDDRSGDAEIAMWTATIPASEFTNETFTDQGVVVTKGLAGGNEEEIFFPYVIKDLSETDTNRVWKMIYSGLNATGPVFRLYYATAPDSSGSPGTWTKRGEVLGPGTAGEFDDGGANIGVLTWHNSRWELWYNAFDGVSMWTEGLAVGSDILSLTKQGQILTWQANGEEAITVNLNGNTVTMADTTGFTADHIVQLNQDSDYNNYSWSRIRKVVSGTQLELYHRQVGWLAATPAILVQDDRAHGLWLRDVEQDADTGEWIFHGGFFRYVIHLDPTYRAFDETTARWRHSGASPSSTTPVVSALENQWLPQTKFGHERSSENVTFAKQPLTRSLGRRTMSLLGVQ
jgi:hypothetical protein